MVTIKLHTKISLLACLILEMAMMKTLKSGFGRRSPQSFQSFTIFLLVQLESSYITKVSLLACLIWEIAMKTTFKQEFEEDLNNISNCFLNISSSLVRINLHTKTQPPSLLNSGDSYEEDLKIRIWKLNSTTFTNFSQHLFQFGQNQVTFQKSASYLA